MLWLEKSCSIESSSIEIMQLFQAWLHVGCGVGKEKGKNPILRS